MAARPAFGDLEARVITLLGEGEFEAALEVARTTAEAWPDRIAYTAFWVASIRGVQGRPEEGLRALREAVDGGDVWWGAGLLQEDPDLESVRKVPEFDELLSECERRERAARRDARVEWTVVEPSTDDDRGAALIVLHGRTGNLSDSAERWSVAAEAGVTTVVLQSSQMVADGMHCWDDLDVAAGDVARAATATLGANAESVLAGFSQGAGVAARLALAQDPVAARGFIAVAPSFFRDGLSPTDIGALLPGAARAGTRAWMAMGERDARYRPHAEEVVRALEAAGVPTSWQVFEDLGHDYPAPFEKHVSDAVSFVLDPTSSISP